MSVIFSLSLPSYSNAKFLLCSDYVSVEKNVGKKSKTVETERRKKKPKEGEPLTFNKFVGMPILGVKMTLYVHAEPLRKVS